MSVRGVNNVILVGFPGQAPEVRYMSNGNAVASFSLATSESWRSKQTGEMKALTGWNRVVLSGNLAEDRRTACTTVGAGQIPAERPNHPVTQPEVVINRRKNIMTTDIQNDNEEEDDIVLTECPRCGCDSYSSQICSVCGYDFSWEDEEEEDDESGESC